MPEKLRLTEQEIQFYLPLIKEYLSHSSVDNVFVHFQQNPGVSEPHFHRILKEWGIVKSAGPNTRLSHALYFLCHMALEKMPLETAYRYSPSWLRHSVSMGTLHRIYWFVKHGLTRRHGTALLVSPEHQPNRVLIGHDHTPADPLLGKAPGAISLPMTYSKANEDPQTSILRVFQQEVSTDLTLRRIIPADLIPKTPEELFSIAIADVSVHVYRLLLPQSLLPHVSSFKLKEFAFVPLDSIASETKLDSPYRAGVPEMAQAFLDLPQTLRTHLPLTSYLNRQLALLPTTS